MKRFFRNFAFSSGLILTVFLIVAELSHASSYGLSQSIAQEAGRTGTYDVDFSTTSGMDPQALAAVTGAERDTSSSAPRRG